MISVRAGFLVALTALAQSPAQIEFVKIAPGEFVMGCVAGDKDCLEDEVPRHKVQLPRASSSASTKSPKPSGKV